jgi:hypothetical protein
VPNGSFESPPTLFVDTRIESWQKTPKPAWYDESGGYLWDQLAGVFLNLPPGDPAHIGNCDSNQAVFLFAVPQVGFFQDYESAGGTNTTPDHAFDARFEVGTSYRLAAGIIGGLGNMKEGVTLQLGLYYRADATNRVTVAATNIAFSASVFPSPTNLVDITLQVPAVTAGDPWAGQRIGIELVSTVRPDLAGGYWDVDNIRLTAAAAPPAFTLSAAVVGPDLRIAWPSATGQQYQLKIATVLGSWSDYEAPLPGTGGELVKLVPLAGRSHVYAYVLATPAP